MAYSATVISIIDGRSGSGVAVEGRFKGCLKLGVKTTWSARRRAFRALVRQDVKRRRYLAAGNRSGFSIITSELEDSAVRRTRSGGWREIRPDNQGLERP